MPYRLSFENAVRGIRFQPIYSVAEKAIKAREILSLLQPGLIMSSTLLLNRIKP